MRRRTRDAMCDQHILERMVHDIRVLLSKEGEVEKENAVYLWDNRKGSVENRRSYGKEESEQ